MSREITVFSLVSENNPIKKKEKLIKLIKLE